MQQIIFFVLSTICDLVTVVKSDISPMETSKKYNFIGVMATSKNISYLSDYLKRNELSSAGVIGWNGQIIDMVLGSDSTLTPYDPLINPCEFTFVIFKYPEKAKFCKVKTGCKDYIERNCHITNEKCNEIQSEILKSNLCDTESQENNNCLTMKGPLNDFYLRPQIRNYVERKIKYNEKVPNSKFFKKNNFSNNSLTPENYMNNIPFWFQNLKNQNDHCDDNIMCFKVVEGQKPGFKHLNSFNLNDRYCPSLSKNLNEIKINHLINTNLDNNCPSLSKFNTKISSDEKLRFSPMIYDEIGGKR
ncbi:hypothetical protein DMUE_4250 [Dictyocoela muelleri]|nr:hypothetical protein DMUE_4250 [Dictyocoela muelleri]